MIYFCAISISWTLTLLTVESSLAVFALIQEGVFNIVKEARRYNLVETFTEWEVSEYKDY